MKVLVDVKDLLTASGLIAQANLIWKLQSLPANDPLLLQGKNVVLPIPMKIKDALLGMLDNYIYQELQTIGIDLNNLPPTPIDTPPRV